MMGPWSRVEFAAGMFRMRLFDPREAAAIVAAAEAATGWRPAGINADLAVDRSVRDAEVLFEADAPALVARCRGRIWAVTRSLAAARAPGAVPAELQIVRYRPGGRYVDHRDSPARGATPRTLSVVCYLNGDVEGGATVFPEQHVEMQPEAGIALVYPPEALHRAEPVTAGTKYVLTAWYHDPPRGAGA
jgi:predicted 2-oxoglutarate/Fe(II)-dependent dioxygenase YbiX